MAIKRKLVEELLEDADPRAVFSPDGRLSDPKKALVERMLNAELDQYLASVASSATCGETTGHPVPAITAAAVARRRC